MEVVTMKSTVIEFQMAPVKSLAAKYLLFGERKAKKVGKL